MKRLYVYTGRVSHLFYDNQTGGTAFCGYLSFTWSWMGTGSQEEYERAAIMPTCKRCLTYVMNPDEYEEEVENERCAAEESRALGKRDS